MSRCLAREYGQPARLLVNRDAAFVALLGIGLDPEEPCWKEATCCNPLGRPFPVADDHPAVRHAAAATMCGLAVKLDDDARDEGLVRRGMASAARRLIAPAAGRAISLLNGASFPTSAVTAALDRQSQIEREAPQRADEPTAFAFGAITSHLALLLGVPAAGCVLETVGRSLGSLVYWRDAWEDREEDARRGRFNPFDRIEQPVIRERIGMAWQAFSDSLQALPFRRHREWIALVHQATETARHPFLHLAAESAADPPPEIKPPSGAGRKKPSGRPKYRRSFDHCCDNCFCGDCGPASCRSPRGGCCDAACDCGPGDSGCCDCNPCDGCDCCSCH